MTMRMEAREEPGRREATLSAGAEALAALRRLARVAASHDATHPAFVRQLDQTHQALADYAARAGRFFSAFFTPHGVFVGGELVRGPRATQEAATELTQMLEVRGVAELVITKDVAPEDLLELARLMTTGAELSTPRIRARGVAEAARTRGLITEALPIDRRIARVYAQAVVSVRRLFDELLAGRYVLPSRIKRLAQDIVDLADSQNPFVVGVTETKHGTADEAVIAVNAAMLAAAMTREIGSDRARALEVVLAALLFDVALPRMRARAVEQTGRSDETPEAEAELPAGTAATLSTLVGLTEASMPRAVAAFEGQWLRFVGTLGPLYRGDRPQTLQARVVGVAHEWARLRAREASGRARTVDDAVAALLEDRQDPSDLAVVRLLVSTLRFFPAGTVVDLDTGEVAEVVASAEIGSAAPVVRITVDAKGEPLARPIEVNLATEAAKTRRHIARVRSVDGWRRLERTTTPAELPKMPALEPFRGSLPSISPGVLDVAPSPDFLQSLREEISEQLADVLPTSAQAEESASKAPPPPREGEAPKAKRPTPNARGTLQTTPLVHVLIYALDHGLTGSVELVEPGGTIHQIGFRRGAPVKVKSGKLMAPLGELLAQQGQLLAEKIPELAQAAKEAGSLFGEHLIAKGLISRRNLWSTLELQIPLKLERLANLPAETSYALFRDLDLLADFGGADAVAADPIHVVHSVVRKWHDRDRIRAALARIQKHPLALRSDAKIGGLKLSSEERDVVEAMRTEKPTLSVLTHKRVADAEELSSLVYALAVTRQLELPGQKKAPMGVRAASMAPPPRSTSAPGSNREVPKDGAARRASSPSLPVVPPRPSVAPGALAPASAGAKRHPSSASLVAAPQPSAAPQIAEAIATALSAPPSMGPVSPVAVEVPPAPRAPSAEPLSRAPSSPRVPAASQPASAPAAAAPSSGSTPSAKPSSSSGGAVSAKPSSSSRQPAPASPRQTPAGSPRDTSPALPPSSRGPSSVAERSRTATEALDAAERSLSAMALFRNAEAAMAKKDFDAAERFTLEALEYDGEPIDYRATLAWVRAQSMPAGDLGPIVASLTDLLVEAPSHPRVLLYRARLLKRQGRPREAIADFEALLAAHPKSKEAATELRALRSE